MELSLVQVWSSMGVLVRGVVVVLAAMSIVSLAVAADRARWLRRARKTAVAGAVELASDAISRAPSQAVGLEAARHVIRRAALEIATEGKRGFAILATVGSTAPFVGLFGTVVGIVNAFQTMAASGKGGLASVSAGIAEALVATALGILVAIPAVWIFNALTHEIGRLLVAIEAAGEDLAANVLAPPHRDRRREAARGDAA